MNNLAYTTLKGFASRSSLSLNDLAAIANRSPFAFVDVVNYLRRENYVRIFGETKLVWKDEPLKPLELDTKLEITEWGRDALKEERRKKFSDVRSWAALGLSIISLVVAIIAIA